MSVAVSSRSSRAPGQILHPASEVTEAQIYAIQAALEDELQTLVQTYGGNTGAKLIYRDLVPNDLFVSGVQTQARFFNAQALTKNTYATDVFSGAGNPLPQNRAIGIYGFASLQPSPQIDQVRFYLGNTELLAQLQLSPLYADSREAKAYFNPLAWGPQDAIRIDMLSNSAVGSGVEQIQILGIVGEVAGATVAGPR